MIHVAALLTHLEIQVLAWAWDHWGVVFVGFAGFWFWLLSGPPRAPLRSEERRDSVRDHEQ